MRYITPRKAAVGLGASHTGTEHHWWMTVSSAALALLTPPQASRLFHKLVPISWGNLPGNQLAPGFIPTLNSVSPHATQASQLRAHMAVADGLAPALPAPQSLVPAGPPRRRPATCAARMRGSSCRRCWRRG